MPAPVSSLIPTVTTVRDRIAGADPQVPTAVWHVLSTITDPRAQRGRRHELATVLLIALCAVLSGARSLAAVADWARDSPRWCWPRLGVARATPSLSTIRRVLLTVDADVLDAVLHAWLAALEPLAVLEPTEPPAHVRGEQQMRAVAVDGKTARGARQPDGSRTHLFSMVDHGTGAPLGQVLAPTKGAEIAAFSALLDRIDLHGVVVTADALHTQIRHAHYLHRHGGHYVLSPSLRPGVPPREGEPARPAPAAAGPALGTDPRRGPPPRQGTRPTRDPHDPGNLRPPAAQVPPRPSRRPDRA